MSVRGSGSDMIRNRLGTRDLPFREFVELALYDPGFGYYTRPTSPVGRAGDYITSPLLSDVFSFALRRLVDEFLRRSGDEMSTVVDIGCGDGGLIHSLQREDARFFGVDRSLQRVPAERQTGVTFVPSIDDVPFEGPALVLSNELYDAFPFARLVMRADGLRELCVTWNGSGLDWSERSAPPEYVAYFEERGVTLEPGQFADVAPDWQAFHGEVCRRVVRGLVVTFDYGYPDRRLFHPRARRFGTAAAYSHHQVTRALLDSPGEQDLTAHINFSDLMRAGERRGFATLYFDRQAKFLLSLGAAEHELLRPLDGELSGTVEKALALRERREEAKRLVLPDGIGHDIRVLVQSKGMGDAQWSFEVPLFAKTPA